MDTCFQPAFQLATHCSITNPVAGGSDRVAHRSAIRMVRAGKAVFVNLQGQTMGVETNTLKLLSSAHEQAENHIADRWLWDQRVKTESKNKPKRSEEHGYDGIRRVMSRQELKGIPFAGNIDRMLG